MLCILWLLASCSLEGAIAGYESHLSLTPIPEEGNAQHILGPSVWERYFGKVYKAPPLPDGIEEILNSPCPFWQGKQVRDTHLLALIPEEVNGRPLTLDYLGELIQSPKEGENEAQVHRSNFYNRYVHPSIGNKSLDSSYWVLITRNGLPGSIWKTYAAQCNLVAKYVTHTGLDYSLPSALEAAVVVLLHHVRSGERLYSEVFIRTRDQDTGGDPVVVGHFSLRGLEVSSNRANDCEECSVVALRKFSLQPSEAIPSSLQHAIFDAKVWERYFGDVDPVPLPSCIYQMMNNPCPFWPEKKVKDTHILALIPKEVNGKPLTLDYLGKLVQSPKGGGHKTGYSSFCSVIAKAIGKTPSGNSYWVLITRGVLEESRNMSYRKQCALVADHAKRTGLKYQHPTALQAAVAILLYRVWSGKYFYGIPGTSTHCREEIVGHFHPVVGEGSWQPSLDVYGSFSGGVVKESGVTPRVVLPAPSH